MNTRFLSEAEVTRVKAIMNAHGVNEFAADVRLWGRGKAIQVTGTLGKLELSCLLEISRFLDNADAVEPYGDTKLGSSSGSSRRDMSPSGTDGAIAVV